MNGCIEELSNRQDSKTLEEGRGLPFSSAIITSETDAYRGGPQWRLSHPVAEVERRLFLESSFIPLSKVQR